MHRFHRSRCKVDPDGAWETADHGGRKFQEGDGRLCRQVQCSLAPMEDRKKDQGDGIVHVKVAAPFLAAPEEGDLAFAGGAPDEAVWSVAVVGVALAVDARRPQESMGNVPCGENGAKKHLAACMDEGVEVDRLAG